MRNRPTAILLVAILLGALVSAATAQYPGRQKDGPAIITRVYKISDLPVFSVSKSFEPKLLLTLIQKTVSPRDWEPGSGHSTLASYPQNHSLIVSTTAANHDQIVELIEGLRGES